MLFELGLDEDTVLQCCQLGLQAPDVGVTASEAVWVLRRLAELLCWPQP
jgi:hypothetical protein